MYTILVTGSRGWNDNLAILDKLKSYAAANNLPVSNDRTDYSDRVELIHGGAKGADYICGLAARKLGWRVVSVPANWANGNDAGLVRNLKMLDRKPDVVLAFWDGRSRGTKHCIEAARERNIPVDVTYL